ncbi:hypothetical protein LABF186_09990 [Lactobacillus amylovorus subsp. animalium]|uniref:Uncharacterized protein n=1 Tax=Lactobacillus amylovorus subsp. animalium TaxID=3378536 RepID=A0ABD0C3K8_LACAM|nr:hypothetical protein LABF186_09990 [Lactobacillus amylovorus]GMM15715.1 hypothetical protein LABF125_08480 [Lactobacillus amylovorus]
MINNEIIVEIVRLIRNFLEVRVFAKNIPQAKNRIKYRPYIDLLKGYFPTEKINPSNINNINNKVFCLAVSLACISYKYGWTRTQ